MLRKLVADQFNYNSSRKYLQDFLAEAAASVAPGEKVLDAGAGDCKYKALFAGLDYTATDFLQVDKPYDLAALDFVGDLHQVALATESYDVIICSQVLEHVREPLQVLGELQRVLKPGGRLWLSTPLFLKNMRSRMTIIVIHAMGCNIYWQQVGLTLRASSGWKAIMAPSPTKPKRWRSRCQLQLPAMVVVPLVGHFCP